MSKRRKRAAALVVLLTAVGAGGVGASLLRFRRLLAVSGRLIAFNDTLPTDYSVGDPKAAPLLYVALGDSTVRGVGAACLEDTVPYRNALALARREHRLVHVVNLAATGARMADVADKQVPALARLRPNVVTITCGANDATHFTPLSAFGASLDRVFAALKESGAAEIAVADTPDMTLAPALPFPYNRLAGQRAAAQNRILAARAGVRVVDLFQNGRLDYNRDPPLYAPDLFHPSSKGYARWAALFF